MAIIVPIIIPTSKMLSVRQHYYRIWRENSMMSPWISILLELAKQKSTYAIFGGYIWYIFLHFCTALSLSILFLFRNSHAM